MKPKAKKKGPDLHPAIVNTSPASLDPITQYMREVARYPLLSSEEEEVLAKKYLLEQDKTSGQTLILSNLRLVVKIALEYTKTFHNILDLIQEGNLGLMRAVEKFDPARQVRFGSYAAWWIRAYILKYLIDNFRLVKVGTTQAQKKLFFNLMKEKEKMEALGIKPTPKLLAEKLDVKENEVNEMQLRLESRELELDAPKFGNTTHRSLEDIADTQPLASDQVEQNELSDVLLKHLDDFTASLGDKEKMVFQKRLFAEIPSTLQDIADQYSISRERIRQIESKVIEKMKIFFEEKGLKVDRRDS